MNEVQDLIQHIKLEQLEQDLFRGDSESVGSKTVFGGQVLAQSLYAARMTVAEDRFVHSLHAYFILPGELEAPLIFKVDRIRDGGSFTTRSVAVIQHGRPIFYLTCSFQLAQMGFEHQAPMPDAPLPGDLLNLEELATQYAEFLPESVQRFIARPRPIEFKLSKPLEMINPAPSTPFRQVWLRSKGTVGEPGPIHAEILAYASDYHLLTTALTPHGQIPGSSKLQLASLDHAMWFHRPFRIDDWLLYTIESPSASAARGFTRGSIYDRSGRLIATVTQEGLMRQKRD